MMPKDHLIEQFFHQNMLLFKAHCELRRKTEQHTQGSSGLARLAYAIRADTAEFEQQRTALNALTFELMLHTPCYKFAKLSRLLDL
jgi:sarcosine oxidase delta subunit